MGIANPSVDAANVVQALVYVLSGVFEATKDLYRNLAVKEQREYEHSLRSKGYPASRRVEYARDERLGSEEAIMTDKTAVVRQFEKGYHAMGTEFAMGDVTAQLELQSTIVTLQSVLVTTTIYGPTSTDSIAHQLSNINAASRAAAARAIEILALLQERQMDDRPASPRSMHSVSTLRSSPRPPPSHVSSKHSSYAPSVTPSQSISCRTVTVSVAPPKASSKAPSEAPSKAPSRAPSQTPSKAPSQAPSKAPSQAPSKAPSQVPSKAPSQAPSKAPSQAPSRAPSQAPSRAPSQAPSKAPSQAPSRVLSIPQPPMGSNSPSAVSVKNEEPQPAPPSVRGGSPVNTTILDWQSKVEQETSVADSTSTGPVPSTAPTSVPDTLYCPYAYELQCNPAQPLQNTILATRDPRCPRCAGALHLSPGKAWEICKWAGDTERTFQVKNRFVVKCHRGGPDAQYCCVICSKYSDTDTVCGDVKALVKHLSEEHDVRELKHEEDIVEVIEKVVMLSKRDSGVGYIRGASTRGSRSRSRRRRSVSVVSGTGRRRKSLGGFERDSDGFEARSRR